jgi:hypothetical protein
MTIAERVARWINLFGYGLNRLQYLQLVEMHETCDDGIRDFIEALFAEINFHTECRALKNRDYDLAWTLFDRN